MQSLSASRPIQILVFFAVCATSAFLGFTFRSSARTATKTSVPPQIKQSDEKMIDVQTFPVEPYGLSEFNVKNTKFTLGQKFNARTLAGRGGGEVEDWLENLEFTLTNKYDKQIVWINLAIMFPETMAYGPRMVYQQDLGINPKFVGTDKEGRFGDPIAIKPNEQFKFKLSSNYLKGMKQFLASRSFQLDYLNQATIQVSIIEFDDGMRWEQGTWYKPDPDDHNKWVRVKTPK